MNKDVQAPDLPGHRTDGRLRSDHRWDRRGWSIAIGLLLLGSVVSCGVPDATAQEAEATPADQPGAGGSGAVEEALGDARLRFLARGELVDLMGRTCDLLDGESSTDQVAAKIYEDLDARVENLSSSEVDAVAKVLADATPRLCPEAVEAHPDLLNELRALAAMSASPDSTITAPSTTSSTTSTTTSTTTSPPTTAPPPPPPTTIAPPPPPPPSMTAPPPPPPPPSPPTTAPPAPAGAGSYANCTEARAAGVTPLFRGDPGYAPKLDRDGDGVACE